MIAARSTMLGAIHNLGSLYWLSLGASAGLVTAGRLGGRRISRRWARVPSVRGFSGGDAAREILSVAGVGGVKIVPDGRTGRERYETASGTLHLSPKIYDGRSLLALGVAAYQAGRVLQDVEGSALWRVARVLCLPSVAGLWIAACLLVLGVGIDQAILLKAGVVVLTASVALGLLRLPVEFRACRRALRVLSRTGVLIDRREHDHVREVVAASPLRHLPG